MSYEFNVDIDQGDLNNLIDNNFYFCVQKVTPTGTTLQWLSAKVLAPSINVTWSETYQVFFTTKAIQNGAVITQAAKEKLPPSPRLGFNYVYHNGQFTTDKTPDVPAAQQGEIKVRNDAGAQFNFGLSQEGTINGNKLFSPLVVTSVPNQGSVTFTPSETITIYFSNVNVSDGCVTTVSTNKFGPLTLTSGVTKNITYKNGLWDLPSSNRMVHSFAAGGLFEFIMTLSASVAIAAFTAYIKAKLPAYTVNVVHSDGTSFTFTANGNGDPVQILNGLRGQTIPDTTKTRVDEFTFAISGTEATILTVEEIKSTTTTLWNEFRALSKKSAH